MDDPATERPRGATELAPGARFARARTLLSNTLLSQRDRSLRVVPFAFGGAVVFQDALRRTVVGAVLLRAFDPSSGYLTLRDADGRWPLVLRSYLLSYDERAVA